MVSYSCHFSTICIDPLSSVDLEAYYSIPIHDRLNIGHKPRLRSLEVNIDDLTCQCDPLPWLHTLFSTIESCNCLEEISLVYSIYLPAPYSDRQVCETDLRAWKDIDFLLSQPTFSSLRKVRLSFALEGPVGYGVAPQFLDHLMLRSPALEGRGILFVDAWEV
jgi:hypothetical protein